MPEMGLSGSEGGGAQALPTPIMGAHRRNDTTTLWLVDSLDMDPG